MSDAKRKTAIHEAGHAVAHVRLALEHAGAHIIPDGVRLLGAAIGEGQEHVYDKSKAERVVVAFCAGYAALVAAGYVDEMARTGADDDFDQACQLIEFWGLTGDIAAWQAQAVQLMRQPENMAAVDLVSKHLLQRERLDGDFVGVLVELADGDATDADFARYLQIRGIAS